MDKFGCTTPFGHYLNNICTDNVTGQQAFELFDTLSKKRHFIEECPYPCTFLKLSAIYFRPRENLKYIKMDFNQYVKVTEAYFSYTELELIAELGGYVGLFLGISVFDVNLIVSKVLSYANLD